MLLVLVVACIKSLEAVGPVWKTIPIEHFTFHRVLHALLSSVTLYYFKHILVMHLVYVGFVVLLTVVP